MRANPQQLQSAVNQQKNIAAYINSLLNGTWEGIGGGWTNRGGSYPPFRCMAAGNLLLVQGNMSTTSAANGATVLANGNMPYWNVTTTQSIPATMYQGTAVTAANELHLEFNTNGGVLLYGINTTGSIGISFSGFIYLVG